MTTSETAVSEADRREILSVAADYIEAWLDGDADRMAGCLHPDLVKREVERAEAAAVPALDTVGRADMVDATRVGYGKKYERPYESAVLDAFGDIATVRLLSSVYMDYLHIARLEGGWIIVSVLWQRSPGV